MAIVEDASSAINTASEANDMGDAILSDLREPDREQEVEMHFFFAVQLGDLYTFLANDKHYSTNQIGAVQGYRHVLTRTRHRTLITTARAPSGGKSHWWDRAQFPGGGEVIRDKIPNTPTATIDLLDHGILVSWTEVPDRSVALYEVHMDTSAVFTPSASTLIARVRGTEFRANGLDQGTTYFFQVRAIDQDGNLGTSSAELSSEPGFLRGFPGRIEPTFPDPTTIFLPGQFVQIGDAHYKRFEETLTEIILGHIGVLSDAGLYELDEAAGATTAVDASPAGNDGTVVLANTTFGVTGLVPDTGTALQLDTDDGGMFVTGLGSGSKSRIVIGVFFKASDTADDHYLFSMANSGNQIEFAVFLRDSDDELVVTLDGTTLTSIIKGDIKTDLLDGNTHFLVAQFFADGTNNDIEIWIDGRQVFTNPFTLAAASWTPNRVSFGVLNDGITIPASDSLEGDIDKVFFMFNPAALLTQAEILEIYYRYLQENTVFERVNLLQAGVGPTMRAGTDPASSHVSGVTADVIFNNTEWDDANALDKVTGRWIAPFDCIVHASTVVSLGTTAGRRLLEFRIDGVRVARVFDSTVTNSLEINGDATLRMRAGEGLSVATFHSTGGSKTTSTDITRTHLSVFVLLEL